MLLDILVEISLRELVLLLGSFLYVANNVLICGLIIARMLRVWAPLVVNADLCAIKSTKLTFGHLSFLFVCSPLDYLVVLCRIETLLVWLPKLRWYFSTLTATHCRVVTRGLLDWDSRRNYLMSLTWSSWRGFWLIRYTHEAVGLCAVLNDVLSWSCSTSLRTQAHPVVERLSLKHTVIYGLFIAHHRCLSCYVEILRSLLLVLQINHFSWREIHVMQVSVCNISWRVWLLSRKMLVLKYHLRRLHILWVWLIKLLLLNSL